MNLLFVCQVCYHRQRKDRQAIAATNRSNRRKRYKRSIVYAFYLEKMNIVYRCAVLLLAVRTILGADSSRTVQFPDSSDENFENFDYADVSERVAKSVRPTLDETYGIKFRIDSTNVPCVNTTMFFCEEVANQAYPKQYVESMMAKTGAQTYKNYFNKTLPNEMLGLRLLSANDTAIELCDSFKRIIQPQLAMSVQRQWHFIINQPSYQQPIAVEICQRKKSKCLLSEPQSEHTSCVQIYRKVPLLSLGEDGQMVSYDYEFPAYCQCKVPRKKYGKFTKRQRF